MKVALFVTCFNDTMFPDTGRATVELLERLGVEVDFPQAQTCCGQMHINTGYRTEAVPLVRRFVETFDDYDAVVTPSASCAGTILHHHAKIAAERGDAALRAGVARVVPRVYELTQFLLDVLGKDDVGAYFPHRVVYHPTCHSLRALGLGDRPYRLLRGRDRAPTPAGRDGRAHRRDRRSVRRAHCEPRSRRRRESAPQLRD